MHLYKSQNLFANENIELVLCSAVCFFVPFLMGHPQFFVGTIVNAALVLAAMSMNEARLLPLMVVPSLGVLCRGLVFGPYTPLLVYMIPFIWLGNAILVFAVRALSVKMNRNKWLSLGTGAVLKSVFLFTVAFIFVSVGVLPAIFLTTMGLFQLYTATAGGIVAFGAMALKGKYL
ncbi:hypothetical protein JXA85_06105 [Candidatus Woesearchaeota archaeon]|nr:hypothetical protein [Candidatus Woesearchaeota archaeon]